MTPSLHRTTRLALIALAAVGASFIQSSEAQDYSAELAAVAALGDLTTAPAIYTDDTQPGTPATVAAGDLKVIYYDVLDYEGNPTRACAWIGLPVTASALTPVPAVVLVHGGGGTAFETWVQKWNERGYAAISISVEGKTETGATHALPGPARSGTYNDTGVTPISDQWMYHAVADTVLANSLMRSLPEVDADKVGVMGVSWGGVITSTVMGIDTRFKFAIPTYGCGHLYDARNHYGAATGDDEVYKQVWDPMVRMANATMPALWYSWPDEPHFPMDSLAYNYHAAPGAYQVSLVPGMGHGHGAAWNRPECYDFADDIVSTGAPWCEQQSVGLAGNTATVVFTSTKPLHTASLVYTTGNDEITSDISTNLVWTETALAAPVEGPAGTWTVTATLPAGVTGWFVNVEATGSDTLNLYGYVDANVTASSDYQEVIALSPTPAGGLAIEHLLALNQSTDTVDVSYTGPANVEVSSIAISAESHPGAFTSLTPAPLIMLNPSPITTAMTIQFDNTAAGLADGETATATLTIVWDELDGSTDQVSVPLSATAVTTATVIYDANSDWSSQIVRSFDDVIIRNGATVIVGEAGPPPNLVVNGSFETPDAGDGSFIINNTAGPLDANWTIVAGGVTVVDSWDTNQGAEPNTSAPSEGEQFLQLQGTVATAGTISQTIATTPGTTYELTFDYSALGFDSRALTITYDVGGGVQTVNFTSAAGQVSWATESFQFTATAATTTLSFTGQRFSGFWGPGIDNVSIKEVPAANLVANGSFEPPGSPDVSYNAFSFIGAGNTALTGWTMGGSGGYLIDGWDRFGNEPNTTAADGDQYLQLQDSGTGAATISQDLTTVVGETYELSFAYSGVDTSSHSVGLTYDVGGPIQAVTYSTGTPMLPWQTETYSFQATTTTTTISFTGDSVGGGFYGVGIDKVSVTKVAGDTAANITVNDDPSPITATLDINQDFALTATTSMSLGAGTGAGYVNQSTGSVTTPELTINSSGTGDTSQYNLSGGELSVSNAIIINANGELNQTGGTISGSGTITNDGIFSYNSTTDQTLSGVISGTGQLVKDNTGTLTLSGANTYTGGTTVNAGILDLAGQNRIDGALTVDGTGIVRLSGTSHNAFAGISSLTLEDGGTFTDNSQGGFVQSVSAPVTFNNGGTMTSEAGANGLGNYGNYLFINGIDVTGTGLATISASGISFNFGETITVADTVAGPGTDLLISSIIKNERVGTNVKAGSGTLTLTGINTDTSPWSITGGTLEIGGAGQLESGSYAGTITNNAAFAYNSTANQTLGGAISGSGALVKGNTGTLTLTAANAYTGDTSVIGGTLSLGNGTATTGLADTADVSVSTGAVLDLNYAGTDTVDELFLGGARAAAGTWGATGSGATHVNDTFFTGTGTLTVSKGTYDAWADGYALAGANAATTADIENGGAGDGMTNLLEFGFGTDPTANDNTALSVTDGTTFTPGQPVVVEAWDGGNPIKLRYVRRTDHATAGLTYSPKFTDSTGTTIPDPANPTPTVVSDAGGGYEVVEVPFPLFDSLGEKASALMAVVEVELN